MPFKKLCCLQLILNQIIFSQYILNQYQMPSTNPQPMLNLSSTYPQTILNLSSIYSQPLLNMSLPDPQSVLNPILANPESILNKSSLIIPNTTESYFFCHTSNAICFLPTIPLSSVFISIHPRVKVRSGKHLNLLSKYCKPDFFQIICSSSLHLFYKKYIVKTNIVK